MNHTRTWILALTIISVSVLFSAPLAAGNGVGDKAPDFSAATLDGTPVTLSDHLGKKPLHLIFWATWCPNCLKEIPEINRLQERLGNRLAILAINVGIDDSIGAVRRYQEEHDMKYPVIFDADSTITRTYGIVGTPTQLLIGTDGVIRYRSSQTPKSDDIEAHWDILTKGMR